MNEYKSTKKQVEKWKIKNKIKDRWIRWDCSLFDIRLKKKWYLQTE